jgi:hypothetical protein
MDQKYDILIDKTQHPIKLYKVYKGKYVEIKENIKKPENANHPDTSNMWIFLWIAILMYYASIIKP